MSKQAEFPRENGPIHLLPSEVVDQIAAGEVVDRPAHLVKELVENSIDAGATSIEIEFDQGGRRVRVTDDGGGIDAEQLSLALARHATSKISLADDLWNLSTFGFRGEALASIAAVSRLTLQSKKKGSSEPASKIVSEFGRLSKVEPSSGNPGTTVLVEELFANVPARLKFLKSESAETSQIKATLRALALANEEIEFRLKSKGRLEHVWPKATFLERARQVLGVEKLYESEYELAGYEAHAVFASPHDVAGNSRSILLFVQGRWVQDRGLQTAVVEAYRGLLMHGEFPMAAVRLRVPPADVDVNIHPTKSQIKFRDPQPAFRAVNRSLRSGLERAPWLEKAPAPSAPQPEREPKRLSVAELTRAYEAPKEEPKKMSVASALAAKAEPEAVGDLATAPVHSVGRFEAPEFSTVQFRQKHEIPASETIEKPVESFAGATARMPEPEKAPGTGAWSRLQVLGQAHLTYILAQDDQKLVLVDQHAAHERIAYERLMNAWKDGDVEVQSFLIPLTLELENEAVEALVEIASELEKVGVVIDQMGPQSVAVRAKPALIKDDALTKALAELGREISEKGGSFALEKKISDLCATMACHSVVRAGQALSLEQMKSLLQQMDEHPLSSFCPHGRPVSVDYPFSKLERDFGRIV